MRLLAILLLTSTAAAMDPGTHDVLVEGHKLACTGEMVGLCLVVDGKMSYSGVEGAKFEWGRRQTLRIEVTVVEDPPADGSSRHARQVELLGAEAVPPGSTFSWHAPFRLAKMGYASVLDVEKKVLQDGKGFTCEPAVCAELEAAVAQGTDRKLTFAFGEPVSGPLRLVAVD